MTLRLRALERDDLDLVHELFNNRAVMSYWFEEPFESLAEMQDIYDRHLHDDRERRFIVESDGTRVGLVELVDINLIHRKCEFQIIVDPAAQGKGYAKAATHHALDYAFKILNLHKVYLFVDVTNEKAVHIYQRLGFREEGVLREDYFSNGGYRDARVMGVFQRDFLAVTTAE